MTNNMVYNMTMIKANIADVKAHLSQYLRQVKEGETLIICERNVPVYEVRVIGEKRKTPRPLGFARDTMRVQPNWDAPMTEAEIADWENPKLTTEEA